MAHIGRELVVLGNPPILLLIVGYDAVVGVADTLWAMDWFAVAQIGLTFLLNHVLWYSERNSSIHRAGTCGTFGLALLVDDFITKEAGWRCCCVANKCFGF